MSAPFPSDLTASKTGNRIAWALDEQGKRNVWVAEGSGFQSSSPHVLCRRRRQEISSISFSADGNTLVYTRGGGKNPADNFRIQRAILPVSNKPSGLSPG